MYFLAIQSGEMEVCVWLDAPPGRNRAGPGIEKALEEMRRNGGREIPDRIGQKGAPSLPTAKQEKGRGVTRFHARGNIYKRIGERTFIRLLYGH